MKPIGERNMLEHQRNVKRTLFGCQISVDQLYTDCVPALLRADCGMIVGMCISLISIHGVLLYLHSFATFNTRYQHMKHW